MDLKDKVAVVTGGSRDIGKAVSLKLAAAGAKVVVNYYNNGAKGAETVKEIADAGGTAIAVGGDMTQASDVDKLVSATVNAFGERVAVLVNVVGGLVARKTLAEMDEDFFDHVIKLNLNSVFLACKKMVPLMTDGGSIVNLSSLAGRDGGGPGAIAYATSKGAVMTMTRGLAKELGPSGIRVNCVCPGMISTTFHDEFTKDAVRKNVAASTPLRREGQAEEVADLVTYLASSESSFLTGTSVDINGGLGFS